MSDGAAPGLLDLGHERLQIGRGAGHGRDSDPFASERQGDGAADPASGAGDESRRAAQLHIREYTRRQRVAIRAAIDL
jgi:hypothetical protein